MSEENNPPLEGEVEPKPNKIKSEPNISNTNVYADVAQYTQRPDLFIAEVEKHDPGFIKRMNAIAENEALEDKEMRNTFGRRQAYTGLSIQVIATVCLFLLCLGLLLTGKLGFSAIIGMAIFYGVIQSGFEGFAEIARGVAKAILLKTKDDK